MFRAVHGHLNTYESGVTQSTVFEQIDCFTVPRRLYAGIFCATSELLLRAFVLLPLDSGSCENKRFKESPSAKAPSESREKSAFRVTRKERLPDHDFAAFRFIRLECASGRNRRARRERYSPSSPACSSISADYIFISIDRKYAGAVTNTTGKAGLL